MTVETIATVGGDDYVADVFADVYLDTYVVPGLTITTATVGEQ